MLPVGNCDLITFSGGTSPPVEMDVVVLKVSLQGFYQVYNQVVIFTSGDETVIEVVTSKDIVAVRFQQESQLSLSPGRYQWEFRSQNASQRIESGEDQSFVEDGIGAGGSREWAFARFDSGSIGLGCLNTAHVDELMGLNESGMSFPDELFEPFLIIERICRLICFHSVSDLPAAARPFYILCPCDCPCSGNSSGIMSGAWDCSGSGRSSCAACCCSCCWFWFRW